DSCSWFAKYIFWHRNGRIGCSGINQIGSLFGNHHLVISIIYKKRIEHLMISSNQTVFKYVWIFKFIRKLSIYNIINIKEFDQSISEFYIKILLTFSDIIQCQGF